MSLITVLVDVCTYVCTYVQQLVYCIADKRWLLRSLGSVATSLVSTTNSRQSVVLQEGSHLGVEDSNQLRYACIQDGFMECAAEVLPTAN